MSRPNSCYLDNISGTSQWCQHRVVMSLYPARPSDWSPWSLWWASRLPLIGQDVPRFPAGWLMSPAPGHYSSDASPVSGAGASLPPLIGQDPAIPGLWLVEAVPSPQLWCIEQKVWPTCSSSRPLQADCSISCTGLGLILGRYPALPTPSSEPGHSYRG